jgi:hypothetical protein
MAVVNKSISAVPAGVVRIDMYESASSNGLFTKIQEISVTTGQTIIAFNAQENYWYKFRQIDAGDIASNYSSAWQYLVDNRLCAVSGVCRDASGTALAGVTVTASLLAQSNVDGDNEQTAGAVSIVTDTAGGWQLSLWKTALLEDPFAKYLISFDGFGFSESKTVTIPTQDTINYEELPVAGSLSSDFNIGFEPDPDSTKWFIGENKHFTFVVTEGENRLSTLPGIVADIRFIKEEDTLDDDGLVVSTATTIILDWVSAEIEGMNVRYLYDSTGADATSATIRYLVDTELTGLNGEKIRSKATKVKLVD